MTRGLDTALWLPSVIVISLVPMKRVTPAGQSAHRDDDTHMSHLTVSPCVGADACSPLSAGKHLKEVCIYLKV